MYQGFFRKFMLDMKGNEEVCPVKNLVSESKERLIAKITEYANNHINEYYDITKNWHEGLANYPSMDVYEVECEVVCKDNKCVPAKFQIDVTPVEVV